MALWEKLFGAARAPDGRPIRVSAHDLYAGIAELTEGEQTRAQVLSFLNLDTDDEVDFDFVVQKFNETPTGRRELFKEIIHRVFMLASSQIPGYNTRAEIIARITRASA